ncbi:leucyl/phenylalanyl-tRNA--protein transferase [Limnohabitans sp. MORI2]|uniref:leucyl/phenylalanyl-tRNA--protein transferase n=1 Tax=Limnohabitans sp. MORI2 TaxID=1751150 RepID=UPI0024928C02|nr:leucyl/phenylalanyl-tRNA--protein transferase [Limnohabitans sp. MORI2]
MNIPWIEVNTPLPPPQNAQKIGTPLAGLVAAGGDLSASRLHEAYSQGIFPWFSDGQPVLWWSPDPRMVLRVEEFKLHRSLRKTLLKFQRSSDHELRFDTAFEQVIRHCAEHRRSGQSGTWITPEMIQAYLELHRSGFAHSIETWVQGQLVGGLYCVSIGDTLFGESMFALQTDASKIALAGLVAFARSQGLTWIDCQQNTRHLASLGAKEIPRSDFLTQVELADKTTTRLWHFAPELWHHVMHRDL